MNSPHFLSTDGRLFRLTLQGTLRPASPEAEARFEAERAAGAMVVDMTGARAALPDVTVVLADGRRQAVRR